MTNSGARQRAKQKKAKQKRKAASNTTSHVSPEHRPPTYQQARSGSISQSYDDPQLRRALVMHKNEALLVKASLLADLMENEQKTLHTTKMKKFAEAAWPTLEDSDQKIEVAQSIEELGVHLSLLCIQKERLVAPTLPTYEQACSHSI
jgi:hypothetical protein